MTDTCHPPVPDRVAAGVRCFDRYYRLHGWYETGRFAPDGPDGTPPGISAIIRALLATEVPAGARPDDPRQRARWDGESYSQSPHLGMVPYPDEDPQVAGQLDALWAQASAERRRDAETARRIAADLPSQVAGFAAVLGVPAPRPGLVVAPAATGRWQGARCVACDTGQWPGTSRCWRCGADQPGVAWAWVPGSSTEAGAA